MWTLENRAAQPYQLTPDRALSSRAGSTVMRHFYFAGGATFELVAAERVRACPAPDVKITVCLSAEENCNLRAA
jgi:hypothetical protein